MAAFNDTTSFVYLKKEMPALAIPPKLFIEKNSRHPAYCGIACGLARSRRNWRLSTGGESAGAAR